MADEQLHLVKHRNLILQLTHSLMHNHGDAPLVATAGREVKFVMGNMWAWQPEIHGNKNEGHV